MKNDPHDTRIENARQSLNACTVHEPDNYEDFGWYVSAFQQLRRELAYLLDVVDGKDSALDSDSHRLLLSAYLRQRAEASPAGERS